MKVELGQTKFDGETFSYNNSFKSKAEAKAKAKKFRALGYKARVTRDPQTPHKWAVWIGGYSHRRRKAR